MDYLGILVVMELNGFQMSIRVHLQKADFFWSSTVFDFVKIRSAESAKLVQVFAGTTKFQPYTLLLTNHIRLVC